MAAPGSDVSAFADASLEPCITREERREEGRGEAAVSGLSIEPVNGSMTASPAAR